MTTVTTVTSRKRFYFATESRLEVGPDRVVRSPHPGDWYQGYQPMLEHFDEVVVLARVRTSQTVNGRPVDGPGVSVGALPHYEGPMHALASLVRLRTAIRHAAPDRSAHFGGKLPGLVAGELLRWSRALGRPFLANVVGDAGAVLRAGTLGPIGVAAARWGTAAMKKQVAAADAVVYVSQHYLQRVYPPHPDGLQLARSNVQLTEDSFATHQRSLDGAAFRLISIGSQDQMYKGHDLLIRALPLLRQSGRSVELHLVGDGRCHATLRRLAAQLVVEDQVIFHGHVGDVAQVRALLDSCDLYVQPSRTEGVPRALIEAMARQLPCVGSGAGGIPELLDDDCIFPVDDLDALVDRIAMVCDVPGTARRQGEANQDRARSIERLASMDRLAGFIGRFAAVTAARGRLSAPEFDQPVRRVVHLLGSLDRGGAEVRTLQLIRACGEGFTHHIILLSGRVGTLGEEYRAAGAQLTPLRIYSAGFPVRFIRLLRADGADVVHSNIQYVSGPLLQLARLAGIRTRIAHFRSDGETEISLLRKVKRELMRRLLLASATHIVGVSPSALEGVVGTGASVRVPVHVVPNGVDLQLLNPRRRADVRSLLTVEPSSPFIVHVGRADIPTKNRHGAVRYFAAHRRAGGSGVLAFVGRDGSSAEEARANRSQLLALSHQLGVGDAVVFLGERHDVADLLRSADLLLFTSTLEGLPGVIMEARAMGVPVVASDVPGAVYLAERLDGIRVLSVDDDSEGTWAGAIRSALGSPPTNESRERSHVQLINGPFDVVTAAARFRELWNG